MGRVQEMEQHIGVVVVELAMAAAVQWSRRLPVPGPVQGASGGCRLQVRAFPYQYYSTTSESWLPLQFQVHSA